ncbi:MAG: 3-phosphoshikimate 1-carboxyvinyltransferase [Clostridia bacterium]|nr:3-phosphoshikimate 1-carboxyvinyltransferase [Clostridia bacterium]
MNVLVKKGRACGTVKAPPSKSMAHRLLICSFLAGGGSVRGIEQSEDIKATGACISALKSGGRLYCNESGSTLRFMIPICLLQDKEITLCGSERLLSRNLSVYEDICRKQGLTFKQTKDSVTVCGPLKSGSFCVPGDISSQFISGLMFALPLLTGDSVINITGRLESRSYLDLTVKALSDFGVKIDFFENEIRIKGNQTYLARDTEVEGDYSNAAFFDALTVLGADVRVTGLDESSLQGDRIYKRYFEMLSEGTPTLDIGNCPDLAPILMAVAAAKNGCRLINTKRLKIKESDRGAAMKEELSKLGVAVENLENEIIVGKCENLKSAVLCGHNDHRIVMALTVLCTLCGGRIEGAQAVAKSLPDFFDRIRELGIEVMEYEA